MAPRRGTFPSQSTFTGPRTLRRLRISRDHLALTLQLLQQAIVPPAYTRETVAVWTLPPSSMT